MPKVSCISMRIKARKGSELTKRKLDEWLNLKDDCPSSTPKKTKQKISSSDDNCGNSTNANLCNSPMRSGKTSQDTSKSIRPLPHDVLCGRGNAANFHSGNTFFRELVKIYKFNYVSGTKPEKQEVTDLVYSEVRNRDPPGRFLKFDSIANIWYDIGEKKAMEKIRQALRENSSEVINEMMPFSDMMPPDRNAAEMMLDLKNSIKAPKIQDTAQFPPYK